MELYSDEEKACKGKGERRFSRSENCIVELAGEKVLAVFLGVIEDNRDFLQSESLLYTSSKVEGNSHLYRNSGFQLMCSIPVTQQWHWSLASPFFVYLLVKNPKFTSACSITKRRQFFLPKDISPLSSEIFSSLLSAQNQALRGNLLSRNCSLLLQHYQIVQPTVVKETGIQDQKCLTSKVEHGITVPGSLRRLMAIPAHAESALKTSV